MVAILAPHVQVPDLKGLGPADRKTGGLVSTLETPYLSFLVIYEETKARTSERMNKS